jgi:hypothetical protein
MKKVSLSRVEAEQREWQLFAQLCHAVLSRVCSRRISGAHTVQPDATSVWMKAAAHRGATAGDEVRLDKPRRRIAPVRRCPYRNTAP